MSKSVEIVSLLVCEDIRREVTNKDIIIGVYGGDIVVPVFPSWISASMWIEVGLPNAGEHDLKLRVSLAGMKPFEIGATIRTTRAENSVLPIVGLQLEIREPTELTIEQLSGKTWKVVRTKKIVKGAVTNSIHQISPNVRSSSEKLAPD